MSSDRWRRIEDLCHAALAHPAEQRAAFLSLECGSDDVLQREIESLLAEESNAVGFMSVAAASVAAVAGRRGTRGTLVGQQLGSYAIRSLLGVGGMGEVYRAHDDLLGRDVAIKVLPSEFTADLDRRARFEREARTLATLNHPHIGAIYGLEDANGVRALVLELVEGETLAERLALAVARSGGGLPLSDTVAIARQIADALDAAHTKGIVHRDLKPANIKITPEGAVKVLDFGLAKAASSDPAHPDRLESRAGVILGTAGYMSPEQARGHSVDKRGDIWAFGCVLYEMVTGQLAFPGDTVSDTIAKILQRDPDWSLLPAATPALIRRLLLRCLTKDPKQRLRDMGDVRIEIDAVDEIPRVSDGAVALTAAVKSPTRWLPWVALGALAFAVTLMVMLSAPWRNTRVAPAAAPVRLSAILAGDASLASFNLQFGDSTILSPDGTVVAFVGQKGDGSNPQLYVRRLDQLQATPLGGTNDALSPFFSPDGGWIGFFADQKLKKIAVSGGAVVTLADAPSPRGGAWSEDDTIVFSPDQIPGTRLLRVPSAGGRAEPLASLAEDEAIHVSPQILPGGKAVLYTASPIAGAFGDANLVVQALPSGARKVVQRGGYHGRYLLSGHLAYIHDGTLFAVPFDLERLEVTGQPVPALEGVTSNAITGGAQFSVSASGTLIYLPGPSIGAGTPLHWMDQQGNTTPMRAWLANWLNPRFSPEGGRLAMEIRAGTSDIWVYEWARDTLTRLTSDPVRAMNPVWTPDGRRIVFASPKADKSAANLYWQPADGTGVAERLTESTNAQAATAWHPSGKFLVFEETTPETNVDLMILPMEGDDVSGWRSGTPTVFVNSPFIEGGAMFSPDGRWIAYGSQESGRTEVYVRSFPQPGGKWQISTGGGNLPTWSRTKRELFYGRNGQIMVAAFEVEGDSFRSESPRLWSDGRYQTRGSNRMFDLHPDGQRFALAPVQTAIGATPDKAVFIFNFFDELRRIAPAPQR
jgi:Tol biopolymer transport system component